MVSFRRIKLIQDVSFFFLQKNLIKNGVHLGIHSIMLHSDSFRYLLPVNSFKFSIINLNYTILGLKSFFFSTVYSISSRGLLLIINASKYLEKYLRFLFVGVDQPISRNAWIPGRLTNFKHIQEHSRKVFFYQERVLKYYKNNERFVRLNAPFKKLLNTNFNAKIYFKNSMRFIKYLDILPSLTFITDNILSTVSVKESAILDIPAFTINDSGSESYPASYPIPGNSRSISSLIFYYNIAYHAIKHGKFKECYNFILLASEIKKEYVRSLLNNTNTLELFSNKVFLFNKYRHYQYNINNFRHFMVQKNNFLINFLNSYFVQFFLLNNFEQQKILNNNLKFPLLIFTLLLLLIKFFKNSYSFFMLYDKKFYSFCLKFVNILVNSSFFNCYYYLKFISLDSTFFFNKSSPILLKLFLLRYSLLRQKIRKKKSCKMSFYLLLNSNNQLIHTFSPNKVKNLLDF